MRNILIERPVRCSPDSVVQRLLGTLEAHTDEDGEITRTLTLDFGDLGLPDLGGLARTARIEMGDPERRSYGTIIPVSWSDAHGGAFPRFTGIIEVSPLSRHEVQLAILGRYSAPLGPLGAMFDAAVGRTIAERTIQHFVDDLARELEAA